LLNLYGPTETTVACTGYAVPADPGDGTVPIGTALAGVSLEVLDEDLRPVSDGAVGELYVGGPGVARGYLDQPELNDERFLPGTDPTIRRYRTGDLVVRLPDGNLDYRGRADNQVKIAGVRIEPAEIERALLRHGVADAVVTTVDEGDERRLLGFVVPEPDLALRTLRAALAEELPRQMVPNEFVAVSAIGTDHHGKRDWVSLVELYRDRARTRTGLVPPRTENERFLAELWGDLLTVENVGATDDFFALGGHSLLAVRSRAAIQQNLGVALAPEAVFEFSVLEDLAAEIHAAQGER
jgi:acyl-coenzyme A synthetase/AMP-(fatty) acid ligase